MTCLFGTSVGTVSAHQQKVSSPRGCVCVSRERGSALGAAVAAVTAATAASARSMSSLISLARSGSFRAKSMRRKSKSDTVMGTLVDRSDSSNPGFENEDNPDEQLPTYQSATDRASALASSGFSSGFAMAGSLASSASSVAAATASAAAAAAAIAAKDPAAAAKAAAAAAAAAAASGVSTAGSLASSGLAMAGYELRAVQAESPSAPMPNRNLEEPLNLQRYAVGQMVYCMRSSGDESIGCVVEYDRQTGLYRVELEDEDDSGTCLYKVVSQEALRESKAVKGKRPSTSGFNLGDAVYVKRSDGSESIGWIKSYDAANKTYKVELEKQGSQKFKQAYANMLRATPPGAGGAAAAPKDMFNFSEPPPPPPPDPTFGFASSPSFGAGFGESFASPPPPPPGGFSQFGDPFAPPPPPPPDSSLI